ncbi:MAG: hypothetical protein ABL898_16550 [Hyphomicrobiaceae bacterium]
MSKNEYLDLDVSQAKVFDGGSVRGPGDNPKNLFRLEIDELSIWFAGDFDWKPGGNQAILEIYDFGFAERVSLKRYKFTAECAKRIERRLEEYFKNSNSEATVGILGHAIVGARFRNAWIRTG